MRRRKTFFFFQQNVWKLNSIESRVTAFLNVPSSSSWRSDLRLRNWIESKWIIWERENKKSILTCTWEFNNRTNEWNWRKSFRQIEIIYFEIDFESIEIHSIWFWIRYVSFSKWAKRIRFWCRIDATIRSVIAWSIVLIIVVTLQKNNRMILKSHSEKSKKSENSARDRFFSWSVCSWFILYVREL